MTHRQALQSFPDTSQASLHKNKIDLRSLSSSRRQMAVAFNFISERTVAIIFGAPCGLHTSCHQHKMMLKRV
jgi:hypothetical protein